MTVMLACPGAIDVGRRVKSRAGWCSQRAEAIQNCSSWRFRVVRPRKAWERSPTFGPSLRDKQGIAEDQKSPPHARTQSHYYYTLASPSIDYFVRGSTTEYMIGYHSLRAIGTDNSNQYLVPRKHQSLHMIISGVRILWPLNMQAGN